MLNLLDVFAITLYLARLTLTPISSLSLCLRVPRISIPAFFFLNDRPTPEIYPLPLHDALPICNDQRPACCWQLPQPSRYNKPPRARVSRQKKSGKEFDSECLVPGAPCNRH